MNPMNYTIVLVLLIVIALIIGIRKKLKNTSLSMEHSQLALLNDIPQELSKKYEEVEFIGKGGFARVFKAKRKTDGKIVAVKIPISLDEATGRTFIRELQNWANLKHPNIVEVHDYNILPVPYIEMEHCENSLEKVAKPMDTEKAAWLVFNIAEGLKYAHSRGIIHRDLKPSNILLKEEIPKISDWGLSKVVSQSKSSTIAGFTPLYAAPEQISKSKFGSTDERTDIWQLGVIFYELVTGKSPFEGTDLIELGAEITSRNPKAPSKLNPNAKKVEEIILTCLQKEKEKRYQNILELQRDIATFLGMHFKEKLKQSKSASDLSRSSYYCGELFLMALKIGDLAGAYKYGSDLFYYYAKGKVRKELNALLKQIKYRINENLEVPYELIEKAEIVVHKIKLGFREV